LIRIMVFRILFLRCLLPSNSPVSIRYICYHSYFCFSAEAIRAAYLLRSKRKKYQNCANMFLFAGKHS
jgi:hypothetical protein